MKCHVCGASLRPVITDLPFKLGDQAIVIIKGLPVLQCEGCREFLIEDGVRAIHREDTRYRRLGQGNFFKRTGHAIADTVTARRPDDSRTVALSMPANAYGSCAIATLWSPREFRNAESIFEWGTAGVGVSAGTNLVREFWPDLKGIICKKK